jgi:hypothetical protein
VRRALHATNARSRKLIYPLFVARQAMSAATGEMPVRSIASVFAGLMMGVAAFAATAGCTQPTTQAYACPAGVPWVPDGYANGNYVPGHCQGQPAK